MKRVYLIYCEKSEVESLGMSSLLQKGEKVDSVFAYTIDCLKKKNSLIKYYEYFDKHKTTKKLKKIINDINNDNSEQIGLLTDKKDLFEFFDAEINVAKFVNHFYNKDSIVVIDGNTMIYNKLENLISSKKIDLTTSFSEYFGQIEVSYLLDKFIKYNEVFNINIKSLVKGTNYNQVKKFKELITCINEDMKIFIYYNIFTSRLGIVIKRLFDFNLNQSAKIIGKDLRVFFKTQSVSYRYKFDNKVIKSDLTNKSFRGYKIGCSLDKDDKFRFLERIEILNVLKKNKINNKIIKEILGENIYFTINQKLKEINQYEKIRKKE